MTKIENLTDGTIYTDWLEIGARSVLYAVLTPEQRKSLQKHIDSGDLLVEGP